MVKRGTAALATLATLTAVVVVNIGPAHADPPCQIDFSHPLLGNCPMPYIPPDPACHMDRWGAHYVCDDHPPSCGPMGCY